VAGLVDHSALRPSRDLQNSTSDPTPTPVTILADAISPHLLQLRLDGPNGVKAKLPHHASCGNPDVALHCGSLRQGALAADERGHTLIPSEIALAETAETLALAHAVGHIHKTADLGIDLR